MNAMLKGLVMTGGTIGLWLAPVGALASTPPGKPPSTVTVNNTRAVPVVVYLERGEFDTRLGTVAPDTRTSLSLPRYLDNDDVRVVVEPRGSADLWSQEITVPKIGSLKVLVPRSDDGYVPPQVDRIPNPGVGSTTVTVVNPRMSDVTVYVEHGAFDTKLGTVPADRILTLDVPGWLARDPQEVKFILRPRAGFELGSQYFTLKKDAHLEVKVPLH